MVNLSEYITVVHSLKNINHVKDKYHLVVTIFYIVITNQTKKNSRFCIFLF